MAAIPANRSEIPTHMITIEVPMTTGCKRIHIEQIINKMPQIIVHVAPGIDNVYISPPNPIALKPRNINQNPRKIGRISADRMTLNAKMTPNIISTIPQASVHPRPVIKCLLLVATMTLKMPEIRIIHPKSMDNPK